MESLTFLLILVVVAIFALPIVAIVTANSRAAQLRGEMATLMGRIGYLEERLENLAQRMAAPAEAPREPVQAAPASTMVSPPREVEVAPAAAPVMLPWPSGVAEAATTAEQAPVPGAIAAPNFASFEAAKPGDSRTLESPIASQWF